MGYCSAVHFAQYSYWYKYSAFSLWCPVICTARNMHLAGFSATREAATRPLPQSAQVPRPSPSFPADAITSPHPLSEIQQHQRTAAETVQCRRAEGSPPARHSRTQFTPPGRSPTLPTPTPAHAPRATRTSYLLRPHARTPTTEHFSPASAGVARVGLPWCVPGPQSGQH